MDTLSDSQLAYLRSQPLTGPNRVRAALNLLDATQDALAQATQLSSQHISLIATGKSKRLALATARKIATALGACVEDIFPPPCVAPRSTTPNGKRLNAARGRKRAA